MNQSSHYKFPWYTLLLACIALLCSYSAETCSFFELKLAPPFENPSLFFPLLTAHFTHWSLNHLIWDLFTFVSLCALLEVCRMELRHILLQLLIGALGISLTFALIPQEISAYRGLSGLCVTLWTVLSWELVRSEAKWWGWAALLLLGLKVGIEVCTTDTIFTSALQDGYVVVWQAHVIGAVASSLIYLISPPEDSFQNTLKRLFSFGKESPHHPTFDLREIRACNKIKVLCCRLLS